MGKLRFVVPNALTSMSIGFGVLAVESAVAGRYRSAAWWILYCVLTDKLDGTAARFLKASSSFGMQLDSLADFLAFGVAPASVFYAFFATHPDLGWTTGPAAWALRAIAIGYAICTALRLARFNVIADVKGADRLFFGVPTTFAGGMLAALFATLLKYGDPSWSANDVARFDFPLLGGLRLDGLMRYFPILMVLGALAMVSTLRVPKIGLSKMKTVTAWVIFNVFFAYSVGLLRMFPEYLTFGAATWLLGSFWFHFFSPSARGVKLPPVFHSTDA